MVAVVMLSSASTPVNTVAFSDHLLINGVVASGAHKEVVELAEKVNIPVTSTLMALGCFSQESDLNLEMLGMHGTVYANHAIMDSDLMTESCPACLDMSFRENC